MSSDHPQMIYYFKKSSIDITERTFCKIQGHNSGSANLNIDIFVLHFWKNHLGRLW